MNKRAVEIAGFLAQSGWGDTDNMPLAADLSPRRYARLENNQKHRAILMDADDDQKTIEFIALAKALRHCGISAPDILAADPHLGLVLMEDFGDRNFGRMIDNGETAAPLYRRALEVLVQLHRSFDRHMVQNVRLPIFDTRLFTEQVALFLKTYIPYVQNREATLKETENFHSAWHIVLQPITALPQTLMLRDFMPDNLMDLPERNGIATTGVLDFQDGGYGPIAYDVMSLCDVARRDGGDDFLDAMIEYYHMQARPSVSLPDLKAGCHILSAQRHMRILGIVTAWSQKTGRQDKLSWLPRIRKHLCLLLADEALRPVREWVDQYSPLT